MIDVRDNWRILLLVALCVVAALALFGPLGSSDGGFDDATENFVSDPTNLQYGLELSGGARVRGTLQGLIVRDAPIADSESREVLSTVADELGVEQIDIRIRQETASTATVEVYGNHSRADVAAALQAAGVDVTRSDVSRGVTDETIDGAVETLSTRIDQTGFTGGQVSTVSSPAGDTFIIVEAPGVSLERLKDLIGNPGRVEIRLGYPNDNGTHVVEPFLDGQDDIQGISPTQPPGQGIPNPHVPVTLTDAAGQRFQERLNEVSMTSAGGQRCFWPEDPENANYCLYTVVDDNITYGSGMSRDLADTIRSGQFASDPSFVIQAPTRAQAEQIEVDLRSGSLPTELTIETESSISPSLAQRFKPLALLTAITAWLGVSFVVYFWYRDVRVAIPMLLTASAEVFLLLGFAAAIGLALDLSHIAGFIAVIGTGLDDLIIMADEILQRKQDVETGRVFQNRFRKAFWVILMAAGTTIIAMSPLAVLSLGDLQGFAIITIVGVIIGVAITRPAYGDVLRQLMLDDVKRK